MTRPDSLAKQARYLSCISAAAIAGRLAARFLVLAVLAIIERYFKLVQQAKGDSDLEDLLLAVANDFGFRGAFLVQYATSDGAGWRVLDTDPGHRDWWREYFNSDFVKDSPRLAQILAGPPLLVFDAARFGPDEERAREMAARGDVIDSVLIPVGFGGVIVGAVGVRGRAALAPSQQTALQMIAYHIFAQFRTLHREPVSNGTASLTKREREVLRLSAEGMTSVQIAEQLGMSARTANQHFDNVADKLGTRNRAHTVAEVIRRGLLD